MSCHYNLNRILSFEKLKIELLFLFLVPLLNWTMRIAGAELVYQTIPVRTIAFCTGIKYCRGKTATFPLTNDDLSKDQELLKSWSYERSKK